MVFFLKLAFAIAIAIMIAIPVTKVYISYGGIDIGVAVGVSAGAGPMCTPVYAAELPQESSPPKVAIIWYVPSIVGVHSLVKVP